MEYMSRVQIEGEESTFRLMPACFALCHAGTVVWQSSLQELSRGLLGHPMGHMNLRVAGISVRSSLVGLARSLARLDVSGAGLEQLRPIPRCTYTRPMACRSRAG